MVTRVDIDVQITEILKKDETTGFVSCKGTYSHNNETPVVMQGYSSQIETGYCFTLSGVWKEKKSHYRNPEKRFNIQSLKHRIPYSKPEAVVWMRMVFPELSEDSIENFINQNDDGFLSFFDDKPELLGQYIGSQPRRTALSWNKAMAGHILEKEAKRHGLTHDVLHRGIENAMNMGLSLPSLLKNPYPLLRYSIPYDFCSSIHNGDYVSRPLSDYERYIEVLRIQMDRMAEVSKIGFPMKKAEDDAREITGLYFPPLDKDIQRILSPHGLSRDEEHGVFNASLSNSENYIAQKLTEIMQSPPRLTKEAAYSLVNSIFSRPEYKQFDAVQRLAVEMATCERLAVITGGPGTGKSTIMEAVVQAHYLNGNKDLFLIAPTGMASKRLSETSKSQAQTGHSLLKARLLDGKKCIFGMNSDNVLTSGCTVIIDETSVMDVLLMSGLLHALPDDAQILFVGDKNQLHPVGDGQPFTDILSARDSYGQPLVPTIELEVVYRNEKESGIAHGAQRIKKGLMPDLPEVETAGLQFIPSSSGSIGRNVVDTVRRFLGKGMTFKDDMLVACPQKPGNGGTDELNRLLSSLLNPNGESIQGIFKKPLDPPTLPVPRMGDRVMMTRNHKLDPNDNSENPKKIMNGDVGTITGASTRGNVSYYTVSYDSGETCEYPTRDWRMTIMAYAATVHKLQGSQGKVVVLPFSETTSKKLRFRNLFYTGWTRAQKNLVVIGNKHAIEDAITTTIDSERTTFLKTYLEKYQDRTLQRRRRWSEIASKYSQEITQKREGQPYQDKIVFEPKRVVMPKKEPENDVRTEAEVSPPEPNRLFRQRRILGATKPEIRETTPDITPEQTIETRHVTQKHEVPYRMNRRTLGK